MDRIDYSKVDPWIRKHPNVVDWEGFTKANPNVTISRWTFVKRRALILKLPMAPSMRPNYRPAKTGQSRTLSYSTVFSIPLQDLKKKSGVEAAGLIIDMMNRHFHLGLQSVQMTVVGAGDPIFEVRRFGHK